MSFRRAVLLYVVAPWLLLLSAAQANMPGTFNTVMLAQSGDNPLNCTGGTITASGANRIHTFTAGSTLTCTGSGTINYLVVAGGGGGGGVIAAAGAIGGGGGAGGLLTGSATLVAGAYSITVGGGGTGGTTAASNGGSGSNSVFNSLTAIGGGGGGIGRAGAAGNNGLTGGSGGGGGGGITTISTGGSGTVGQGNAGGNSDTSAHSGGGGGCGGVGRDGAAPPEVGGIGCSNSISGGSVTYAAGGGSPATGSNPGVAGTVNTGNGGGGGFGAAGGAGGSGIVIVSYVSIPLSLGTASNAATGTTIALTAGASIISGDTVVVSVGHLTASGTTVTGVTDGTNNYFLATSGTASTTQEAELWYCTNCQAVVSPVITATFSVTAASRVIGAARLAGGVRVIDAKPAGVGSTASSAPTVSTGALGFSGGEVIFGFLYINSNPTVTEGSGFTLIYNENAAGVTDHLAYQVVSTNSTVAYSPTTGTANNNVIMVVGFH